MSSGVWEQRHPRAIVDLADDIETLLKRIKGRGLVLASGEGVQG